MAKPAEELGIGICRFSTTRFLASAREWRRLNLLYELA